jgi:hypothetical protein
VPYYHVVFTLPGQIAAILILRNEEPRVRQVESGGQILVVRGERN